jgi:hypothetical protein
MSGYGQAIGYAQQTVSKVSSVRPARKIRKEKKMKLSLKQRFRNWLNSDELEQDSIVVEADRLASEGMRLQIYRASGGYVIETRSYDRRKDENFINMHVITEEQDLGDALGKIVMMEALKR